MTETATASDQLRTLAAIVRANPNARDAIANAFDLIAEAMEPCIDCGHPDLDELDAVPMVHIAPEDNPETGA